MTNNSNLSNQKEAFMGGGICSLQSPEVKLFSEKIRKGLYVAHIFKIVL